MRAAMILYIMLISISFTGKMCTQDARPVQPPDQPPELVPFSFVKKPLMDIADELAQKKNINLIYPASQEALAAFKKQLITYQPKGLKHRKPVNVTRIPLAQAWNLLQTFMELSGFSLIRKNDNLYEIETALGPNGATATRDLLPLYVDTKPSLLPNSDERIRYLYFLSNLKVPSAPDRESNSITKVLKELLTKDATVLYDTNLNGILMVDRASHIIDAANILDSLDKEGFKEDVAYIKLFHVPSADVVKVLESLKKAGGHEETPFQYMGGDTRTDTSTHFGADTKIIGDDRNNGIILLGRPTNIARISDFITQLIDVEPEKGQSILHSYDLQYLDAQTFAPQLQTIVSAYTGAGSQATEQIPRGSEQFFKGVQIVAEPVIEGKKDFTTYEAELQQKGESVDNQGIEGVSSAGGNRLIIAARQEDWRFIKTLIEKLDIPQYQVVLEMFLVDFTYDETTALEGDSRNRTNSGLPNGIQYLASHITPVSNVLGATPLQLAEDLLQVVGPQAVSTLLNPGSTLISFNDPLTPGIWGLLLALQKILKAKITTSPYLFITNHKKGSIESQEIMRTSGDLSQVAAGSFTIPIEDVPATIKVEAVPHILTDEKVRLDIALTTEEFVVNTFNRLTRNLKTTATLRNGQILAMGGLIKDAKIEIETNTPFFARIPLIGWFFKGRNFEYAKTNITLFVAPTIIAPRKRQQLTKRTRDRICFSQEANLQQFFSPRDPISHIFLKEQSHQLFNKFLWESSNLSKLRVQDCTVPEIDSVDLLQAKKSPKETKPFKADALKEVFAEQKNPFLGIKKKGKLIFNG